MGDTYRACGRGTLVPRAIAVSRDYIGGEAVTVALKGDRYIFWRPC